MHVVRPSAGKYDLVIVTHASAVVKASTVGRQPCQLDRTTQSLIDLIFDEDTFKGAATSTSYFPIFEFLAHS